MTYARNAQESEPKAKVDWQRSTAEKVVLLSRTEGTTRADYE